MPSLRAGMTAERGQTLVEGKYALEGEALIEEGDTSWVCSGGGGAGTLLAHMQQ